MLTVGAVPSVDAVAATRPVIRVAGCTPMSAKRLMTACCIRLSVGALCPSCTSSRPQVYWMVPAPKTNAPLAAR